jgi:hypothetical protein
VLLQEKFDEITAKLEHHENPLDALARRVEFQVSSFLYF